jgi:hypothetical protein
MASTYQQMMAKALGGETTPAEPVPRNQDFALHKRNLKRMVDGGSTEEDINGYLSHEGITGFLCKALRRRAENVGRPWPVWIATDRRGGGAPYKGSR